MKEQRTKNSTNNTKLAAMTIIDSTIHSTTQIIDRIGDLKPGDKVQIQCRNEREWLSLPHVIKAQYPYSTIRCSHVMDDLTHAIKLTVIS